MLKEDISSKKQGTNSKDKNKFTVMSKKVMDDTDLLVNLHNRLVNILYIYINSRPIIK